MKSVEEIREEFREPTSVSAACAPEFARIRSALRDILDHVDRLNGRTAIMRDIAEGEMEIVRKGSVVPAELYYQRDRSFVKAHRELLALGQAVNEVAVEIVSEKIRERQRGILSQDSEYQRVNAKDPAPTTLYPIKYHAEAQAQDICGAYRPDVHESVRVYCGYAAGHDAAGGEHSWEKIGALFYQHNWKPQNLAEPIPPVDYTQPHAFDLDKTTGLPHVEYPICKCGMSKGNVIHPE